MAQNISDFYRVARDKDFARQFQFRLIRLANTNFGDDNLVYLETANLPGRAITNVPVPFMGLQFNVPGTATYPGSDAYNVTFRCDSDYAIRIALENATINTFDDATSTGSYKTPGPNSTIIMALLNSQMQPIRNYTLVGAYVQSVGESTYNMGDNGQVVTIPAVLAYQYWRVTQASLTPTVFSGN